MVIKYIDISSVTVGRLEGTTEYSLIQAPSRISTSCLTVIPSGPCSSKPACFFIHRPEDNLVVSTGFAVLTPRSVPPCYLYDA